jgi:SAM-dependent methyltransferase
MTYIFQPARFELEEQIKRYSHVIRGRILDVGSGSRPRYRGFFKECSEYIKLDIEGVPDIDVSGSAESIPLPNESFDAIISTQVIGDVFQVRSAFSEFIRVLKPGGILLLTEAFMDPLHDEPHDYWRFTHHSLKKLAEDAGFVVEKSEKRGGYRSVCAQFMLRYWIERYHVYGKWYQKPFSLLARMYGQFAIWRDSRDTSQANTLFFHGVLLLARKG